jgi:hypothetical protein
VIRGDHNIILTRRYQRKPEYLCVYKIKKCKR